MIHGGQQLLKRHRAARVVTDRAEMPLGYTHALFADQADHCAADAEVRSEGGSPSLLCLEPLSESHAVEFKCNFDATSRDFLNLRLPPVGFRHKRLQELLDAPPFSGSRRELMRASGLTKGRISQLLDAAVPFGDLAAERLTKRLGLAPDYFTEPPPPADPAFIRAALAHMDPEQREAFLLELLQTRPDAQAG